MDPLPEFLASVLALLIGILLFYIHKKTIYKKFADSASILLLTMACVGLTVPLLVEHKGFMYFFSPIYAFALIGWLFFVKNEVFDKTTWKNDPSYKGVIAFWFFFIGLFFAGTVALAIFAPEIPAW